ncbi:MAG: hypothetical protein KC544_01855 [Gemmatimonadetes bacterium]|nr:hypothetical protein [Gemmatimonadota bacterium]
MRVRRRGDRPHPSRGQPRAGGTGRHDVPCAAAGGYHHAAATTADRHHHATTAAGRHHHAATTAGRHHHTAATAGRHDHTATAAGRHHHAAATAGGHDDSAATAGGHHHTGATSPAASPPPPPPPSAPVLGLNGSFEGRSIFPANNAWNTPIDAEPVDPNSAAILAKIGLTDRLHPDFGANWNGGPFGIPYIVVPDTLTRSAVTFDYASESDPGPYPIPPNPPIEPGGDRHLLVVVQGEYRAYELFNLRQVGGQWRAGSGAIWDLAAGNARPAGWTSADAAGLPILPGLVRYDEVHERGEITHALRFTVSRTRRAYLPPASHWASSSTDPLDPPMGMRVRLKASFDESGYPAPMRVILRALKRYGMIVADNGSDFYLSGTADARWNDGMNNTLKQLRVSDFEVVRMQGLVTP